MSFWEHETEKGTLGVVAKMLKAKIISAVSAERVLVLSPHPDDDVIGCGGLLKLLAGDGAKIKVVYFSDGSFGTKDKSHNKSLIPIREEETREAGKMIGVGEEKFLRLSDLHLQSSPDLAAQIRREIEFDKPDLILAPSFEDLHPDHLAVAEVLYLSLRNFDDHINIWLYEVWGLSRFNRLVIINDTIEDKIDALRVHKTQMANRAYDEAILGLNKYRAMFAGVDGYAEAYYSTGPRNYRRLFEVFSRHHESKR